MKFYRNMEANMETQRDPMQLTMLRNGLKLKIAELIDK